MQQVFNEKDILAKSIATDVAHATVIPFIIMIAVNVIFDGNWGTVAAIAYLILPTTVYYFSSTKDVSGKSFIYSLGVQFGFLILIMFSLLLLVAF